jgi:hypothetical protein
MKLCLCILLAACAPAYSTTASTTFASTYSCPVERQTITRQAPPADIANDPDRLAMWNESNHTYEVAGCGRTATLECAVTGDNLGHTWVDCNTYPGVMGAR